jgi:hypothetical protein
VLFKHFIDRKDDHEVAKLKAFIESQMEADFSPNSGSANLGF